MTYFFFGHSASEHKHKSHVFCYHNATCIWFKPNFPGVESCTTLQSVAFCGADAVDECVKILAVFLVNYFLCGSFFPGIF